MVQTILKTLNLPDFCSETGRAHFVGDLGDGLRETGFVIVEGHGIDQTLIRQTYRQFQTFFALPEAVKQQYWRPFNARGFTGLGQEVSKRPEDPDLKEYFHVGRDFPGSPAYLQNPVPTEVPELINLARQLYQALEAVSRQLLRALTLYFEVDQNFFEELLVPPPGVTDVPWSILRVIHYPPLPPGQSPRGMRSSPHEDINLITLLCEATAPGLEIFTHGQWWPIQAAEGQIIVDAGGMLTRLVNDWIPATTHRVVNPPANQNFSRYSMPFFVYPYGQALLKSISTAKCPASYPPIIANQFLKQRLQETGVVRIARK
jgi:isopenicillin N synthase-like dioxygenase